MIRDRRPNDFAARNGLLFAALGLLSTREQLLALLERHAAEPTDIPADPDEVALAWLGVLSLLTRVHTIADGETPVAPQAPVPGYHIPEGLLR